MRSLRDHLYVQLYVLEGELDSEEVDCMRVYRMKLGLRTHAWELVVPRTFSPPARRFSTVCETNKVSNCGLILKLKLRLDDETVIQGLSDPIQSADTTFKEV